jgi:hypothetical protein
MNTYTVGSYLSARLLFFTRESDVGPGRGLN